MPTVSQMNLRLRSRDDALGLLRLLGYEAKPLPFDAGDLGVSGDAVRLTSHRSPAQGYGILVGELGDGRRPLRTLGRRLVDRFHDRPLALLGVPGSDGSWKQLVIVRPRLITGGGGGVSIAKLTVDLLHPTAHDAEVVNGLAWDASDERRSHERIDRALDIERVTRRFFEGLTDHHRRVLAAVEATAEADPAVLAGIERAGGAERVSLRIITQVLFCYFVQKKGLLESNPAWIRNAYARAAGRGAGFYKTVLEPLFYDALAKPLELRSEEWQRPGLPFLNGGLFERHYGEISLPLPDDVLSADDGLIGFLDRWTFTVSEEAADESEVAVDPEMLGRVFESLIPENVLRREGTVYTPRPVVQFMCREALVPYLEERVGLDEARARAVLLDDEILPSVADELGSHAALGLARRLDEAAQAVRVLDPAVGSGAFLLGMMSELIRLRRLCHRVLVGAEPTARDLWLWKLDAVERSLFGVDVNATAIELCRLRLWLSLIVEEESGDVHPLPNLEYRTVCADSLRDFVAGVEVQQTRSGALTLGLEIEDPDRLVALRERYFEAFDPAEKRGLRAELSEAEDRLVRRLLDRAAETARSATGSTTPVIRRVAEAALAEQIPELEQQFHSRDRVFPAFIPGFHAPDVSREGGWDIVVMNPPYVGRKEVAQRFDASYRADLERHYGRTSDLMIHFGIRAFELARAGGSVSMIFNDSIFTSTDATAYRRSLLTDGGAVQLLAIARTRCFEGKAVNGGVIVATERSGGERPVRFVENYGRPPADLIGASVAAERSDALVGVGESELWVGDRRHYLRLPHRPLFRPSPAAVVLLDRFEESAAWSEFGRLEAPSGADWEMLSKTPRLDRWKAEQRRAGFYARLRSQRFVMLGIVLEGGQGLATADDRRFLAAIEDTPNADDALERCARYERLVLERPGPAELYRERREAGRAITEALLDVSERFTYDQLGWSRIGLIRTAPAHLVCRRPLTAAEVESGIQGDDCFVPFEKSDSSDARGGARWRRENPFVIDWSPEAVALLRARARQKNSSRTPNFGNEHLWGRGGVTWNRVARYFRARLVPEGGIFSTEAPTVAPVVDWLSTSALLALLNAPVADFLVRTFLGSLMHVEIGDIRRLPIPVLSDLESECLNLLGDRAVAAKAASDGGLHGEPLAQIEIELDAYVRELYRVPRDAELWVVR
jgi:hypothetical protein